MLDLQHQLLYVLNTKHGTVILDTEDNSAIKIVGKDRYCFQTRGCVYLLILAISALWHFNHLIALLYTTEWADNGKLVFPKEETGSDCFSHATLQCQGYELLSPISHENGDSE